MGTQAPEDRARATKGAAGARRGGRRLALALVVGLAAALALRAAAPAIARLVVEAMASRAIAGEVRIGDLDLDLRGREVSVRDVTLRDPASLDTDPPVISLRGASARFSLSSLRRREIRIHELVLDTPVIDLDRLEDGRLNLAVVLGGRSPEEAPPSGSDGPAPAPAEPEAARSWRVALDQVRLVGGRIEFRDFAVAGSEVLDVEIETLEVERLATGPGVYTEPARIRFAARAEDARVAIDGQVQALAPGFVVQATLRAESLPLRNARVYLPEGVLGEVEGRLDAQLAFDYATDQRSRVVGTATLRDLLLHAPGDPDPALRFARLDAELREIDLDASRAVLGRVTVQGPELAVTPEGPQPIPLLAILPAGPDEDGASWSWSLARIEVDEGRLAFAQGPGRAATSLGLRGSVEALSSAPGARARVDAAVTSPPASMRWKGTLALEPFEPLGEIEIASLGVGRATSLLPAGRRPTVPADLMSAEIEGSLRLEPGRRARGTVSLRDGTARIEWEGAATAEPLAAAGELRVTDVDLRRLVAFAPPDALPGAFEVERGRVGGSLAVEASAEPMQGISARGTIRIDDASLRTPGERGPAASLRLARVDVESLRAPGVFAAEGDAARAAPVEIALSRVRLRGPRVRLAREAGGFVWAPPVPALREAEGAAPPEAAPDAPASPVLTAGDAAPEEGDAPVRLRVARAEIDDGEVQIVDRGVSPWYQGRYTEVSLRADDFAWPWAGVAAVKGSLSFAGAPVTVEGKGDAKGTTLVVRGEKIALPPLNPYFTAHGYGVRQGTLSLVSSLWIGPAGFDAKNWLTFHDLDLGGASGEALFRQEFGVSLAVALPLLRDLSGDISLTVPMWLGRDGFGIGVSAAVRSAIAQALTWALASPLKILRAAIPSFGKANAPVLEAIPFAPGAAVVDPAAGAAGPIDALSALVAASPGLRPTLEGVVGEADERALRVAVLQERLGGGLLGSVRRLTGVGIDARMRDFLAGETTSLSPEDEAELESRLAQIEVAESELRALARAREVALRDWLAEHHGVTAVELAADPADAPLVRGEPSVRIRLGGGG